MGSTPMAWVAVAALMAAAFLGVGCGSGDVANSLAHPGDGPPAGNSDGSCDVPADARLEDTSRPTTVIGTGTPASCTGDAFVVAVAKGGVITFDCGPDPVTIRVNRTAKVVNDASPRIVIDGKGQVTLDGAGQVRILYQNTCDPAQVWTTSHCQDQEQPQLTVQNLTFINGNAKGLDPDGGGAIFARGGRLKVINCRFFSNVCDDVGPDVGGAAIRAFDQYQDLPLYVVNSTFGGASRARQRLLQWRRTEQHRRLLHRHQQPVQLQPGHRQWREPRARWYSRRWQRRGDLQRRQYVHAQPVRHEDHRQHGARRRWRHILREQ